MELNYQTVPIMKTRHITAFATHNSSPRQLEMTLKSGVEDMFVPSPPRIIVSSHPPSFACDWTQVACGRIAFSREQPIISSQNSFESFHREATP
jgi:hypothetical protein